jgi:hypothetical protein
MIDDISTTEKKNVRIMSRILFLTLILLSTVQPPSHPGTTKPNRLGTAVDFYQLILVARMVPPTRQTNPHR